MGNEILPPVAAIARRNLFHCQFPFPMHASHVARHWRRLDGYDGVIVNSAFTADHVQRAMDRHGSVSKDIVVVPPPVPQRPGADRRAADSIRGATRRILSVGRFAPGGHCKRQDAMIAAFRQLQHCMKQPLELHLAGALGADPAARDHLQTLIEAARDLPVRFHVNPSAARLNALYAKAELYWHLTGLGRDLSSNPELYEHFGIAVCEAMSAGVVPLALEGAGPAEILTDGVNGLLIADAADLISRSADLLAKPSSMAKLREAAVRRASDFTSELFACRFEKATERLCSASRAPSATSRVAAE